MPMVGAIHFLCVPVGKRECFTDAIGREEDKCVRRGGRGQQLLQEEGKEIRTLSILQICTRQCSTTEGAKTVLILEFYDFLTYTV